LNQLIIVQAMQTAALLTVSIAMIYALTRASHELKDAGAILRGVVNMQNELNVNVRRLWERIDAIEARHGIQGDAETFMRMKRLLDALEASAPPRPPAPSP
jgi:hypothetical protein